MDSVELQKLLDSIEVDDKLISKDTWRANLSNSMLGVNKGKPGRQLTDGEKEHLCTFNRTKSEETKQKLSKPGRNAGRVQTEEEKQKRSLSGIGKNKGKTHSIDSKIAMGRVKSKYIYQTPSGIMLSRVEVHTKYVSSTFSANVLDRYIVQGLNGFSRELKTG